MTSSGKIIYSCHEPGKTDSLKMLDLQTKSAKDSDILQVQH
jgi:hypothetical protein